MRNLKIGLAIALLAAAYWFVQTKLEPMLMKYFGPHVPANVATLKPTEQEKFMVTEHHVTTIRRGADGKTEVTTEYVPKRAVITLNKDGSVSVKNQKFGFTLEPNLGVGYTETLRLAPNVKVLYFERLGLNTGVSFRLSKPIDPRLFAALSYSLMSNTSIFIGVDHRKEVIAGISVRL